MKPTPPHDATRRARRFALGVGVSAPLVMTVFVGCSRETPMPLDPDLVAVATLTNETGDAALEPLGRMVAERIAQGIQQHV
ncbi:MAG: hypothetical protein ACYSTY_13360, partial [Planctomycetota bacterium]